MNENKSEQMPAIVEHPVLILEGDPEAQLAYAQKAADALMKRVEAKPRKIVMNGKQYLEFGDWQMVSRFFGATVGTEWSRTIERNGKIVGYEARAAVHQHDRIIATAEAMCLTSERNWAKRDEFAIRSMAQTRAGAKALRNAFGWVVELKGYASTPAEEIEEELAEREAEIQLPETAQPSQPLPLISVDEAIELRRLIQKSGTSEKDLLQRAKIEKLEDLQAYRYANAKAYLESLIS